MGISVLIMLEGFAGILSGSRRVNRWYNRTRCVGQMQGACLYPFTLEKQTAMRMVLEDLVINSGIARKLSIVQVSHNFLPRAGYPAFLSPTSTKHGSQPSCKD